MLTPEIRTQIKHIHLRTRRLVDGPFAGDYLSIFKGRGTEFAEVREYEAGDDVRTIDWKVTARTGRTYVKQYTEERELCVMLLADISPSTLFSSGPKTKRTLIAEICAAISMNALRHNNTVGLLTFSDRQEAFVPPGKGRYRTYRILEHVLGEPPQGKGTDIRNALQNMQRLLRQRTMCFLISDFASLDYERSLALLNRRHDLIPICITDPLEREFPDRGLLQLRDLESHEPVVIDTADPAFRIRFETQQSDARDKRIQAFNRLAIKGIEVDSHIPFFLPMKRYFRQRESSRNLRAG